MAMVCQNCGKSAVYGHSQQHRRGVAGKRWKKRTQITQRMFKPNIQVATVINGKGVVKMNLCTSCISKFKKLGKIKN